MFLQLLIKLYPGIEAKLFDLFQSSENIDELINGLKGKLQLLGMGKKIRSSFAGQPKMNV
jgi:hypothetical protein